MAPPFPWLEQLRRAALDFCEAVAVISGPPDIRPWNADQVLWAGRHAPTPADPVFAYYPIGAEDRHVAILGTESRACFSRFVETFSQEAAYRDTYGHGFLRDILVGLLRLSLPDAPPAPVSSPYWKRYVSKAVAQLQTGSPERYADAVLTAISALPMPHPTTLVILPLAGIHLLSPAMLSGITFLPGPSCTADPDLAHCGMFLHRLKDLRGRTDGTPLVFAKLGVGAEPGLAVQRTVHRTELVCHLLRLLPSPGLADGPLADPPRIDLDASDSAAFYISEVSVGTHPIPVRRTTSEPQGRIESWRVAPSLRSATWTRMAGMIEAGPGNDVEARLVTALRHLGEAMAEPSAAAAVLLALQAVTAMIGPPEGGEPTADMAVDLAVLLARTPEERRLVRDAFEQTAELGHQLAHDMDRQVSLEQRAAATWSAFSLLEALLARPEIKGYRDLRRRG
jgi:hypothetical protein